MICNLAKTSRTMLKNACVFPSVKQSALSISSTWPFFSVISEENSRRKSCTHWSLGKLPCNTRACRFTLISATFRFSICLHAVTTQRAKSQYHAKKFTYLFTRYIDFDESTNQFLSSTRSNHVSHAFEADLTKVPPNVESRICFVSTLHGRRRDVFVFAFRMSFFVLCDCWLCTYCFLFFCCFFHDEHTPSKIIFGIRTTIPVCSLFVCFSCFFFPLCRSSIVVFVFLVFFCCFLLLYVFLFISCSKLLTSDCTNKTKIKSQTFQPNIARIIQTRATNLNTVTRLPPNPRP